MAKKFGFIVSIGMVFLAIFGFAIPLFKNSTMLCGFLATILISINGRKASLAKKIINVTSLWVIPACQVAVALSIAFFAIVHNTGDFSIIGSIFSQVIYYFIVVLLLVSISPLNTMDRIVSILVYAFLLQSIIIIIGFASPSAADFIRLFQDPSQVEVAERYGGIRGLALSGGQFFNLSVAYAVAILLLFYLYASNWFSTRIASFVLLIFLISVMFVGRTSYLGLVVGIGYLLVSAKSVKIGFLKVLHLLYSFLTWLSLLFFIFYLLAPPTLTDKVFNHVFPFAYEFVFNYLDGKGVSTVSTDELDKMYYPLEGWTWIFGDGRYLNPNGTYYGSTDAGYMRNALFGGGALVAILFLYQWICFYFPKYKGNNHLSERKLIFLFIFLLLAVLHYKGEVIGYLIISQVMVFYLVVSNFLIDLSGKDGKQGFA